MVESELVFGVDIDLCVLVNKLTSIFPNEWFSDFKLKATVI